MQPVESRELPTASLSVQEVTVSFGGIVALEDVSLEVSSGEVLGVIGPNGAGKTTLFNVISGFVRPDSGTLEWRGHELGRHRPHSSLRSGSPGRCRESGCSGS